MPPLQPGFAKDTAFLSAKAKSSRIRHSLNSGTVRRFPVLPTPCAKTREFGEAEFSDCLPVFALVCVFAFDTGGLGLWLGAFGRSRLYSCQSVPGPPMPCFVARCFGVWHRASFWQPLQWHRASFWQPLQPWFVKETAFFFAKAQNLRIRLVPNSWDSYAGFFVAQSFVCGTELCFMQHRKMSLLTLFGRHDRLGVFFLKLFYLTVSFSGAKIL